MAPFKSNPRSDKDQQIKLIISFATTAQAQLPAATSSKTSGTLFDDLQQQISTFPNYLKPTAASRYEEIDSLGTALWNISTQLRRDYDLEHPDKVPLILLLSRVFAFLLLEWPNIPGSVASGNLTRLMKTGIKVVKNCLEKAQFDLALKVLEKLAAHEQSLRKSPSESTPEVVGEVNGLLAEYEILRIALAWKQDKLDLAEHIYQKSLSIHKNFDPRCAETLADTLCEIGRDLLARQQVKLASKWLDRAHALLDAQELDMLSSNANELRISIIQSTIKASLEMNERLAYENAASLANLLEQELGDRMVVLLIRVAYGNVLQRMIKCMGLTDVNVKVFLKHVRNLSEHNADLACKSLDIFLKVRILREGGNDWIERVIITRLWITVSQKDESDQITPLKEVLSAVEAHLECPISPAATVAAHTLLWKRIESTYTQQNFLLADHWCRIALHHVFDKSSTVNVARISRKLMLCALGRQDMGSARNIYDSMTDKARNEPATIFLMYKVALRCGETELVSRYLEQVSLQSTDLNLLYACVLDAQQAGDKMQVLAALQAVLTKIGFESNNAVYLPALLRITIKLLVESIDGAKAGQNTDAVFDSTNVLCQIFEGACKSLNRSGQLKVTDGLGEISELDWFSKHSYNLTMRNVRLWHPEQSLRMITCSIIFIDQYPQDIGKDISESLSLRKMFCEYTAAICLVNLARGEDVLEQKLQYYLRLRKDVHVFDGMLQERLGALPEAAREDLLRKLESLMAYDCEAACQLKSWDDLSEIILKAKICKSMRLYLVMADCLLSCSAPTPVLINNLKKIINEAWAIDGLDASMLAKYMRCLFALSITDNRTLAEQVLGEVQQLAEESFQSDHPFPTEEVEWIAANAFNYSIDLYCNGEDQACKIWSARALNLAKFCGDEGRLERTLQTKLLRLRFDTER